MSCRASRVCEITTIEHALVCAYLQPSFPQQRTTSALLAPQSTTVLPKYHVATLQFADVAGVHVTMAEAAELDGVTHAPIADTRLVNSRIPGGRDTRTDAFVTAACGNCTDTTYDTTSPNVTGT